MDYFEENKRWWTSANLSFWGIIIQTVFSLIGLCLGLYLTLNLSDILINGIMPSITSESLDYYNNRMIGYAGGIMICVLISFIGYGLYLIGISLFPVAQISSRAQRHTRNIMLTELIALGVSILLFVLMYNIPEIFFKEWSSAVTWGILVWCGYLAVIIIMMCQYKALSQEKTWSKMAKKGADKVTTGYIFLIWIQVIVLLGLLLDAIIIWSHFSHLNSTNYDGFESYNNAMSSIQNLFESIKVVGIVTSVVVTILSLFSTISRIAGWNMIKNGGLKAETEDYGAPTPGEYIVNARFCHKCGSKLPSDSSFCPACGTRVGQSVAEGIEPVSESVFVDDLPEQTDTEVTVEYDDFYDDDNSEKRKKLLLWGGLAVVAVLLIALIAWSTSGCGRGGGASEATDSLDVDYEVIEDDIVVEIPQSDYSTLSASSTRRQSPNHRGTFRYEGTINGKYKIVMELTNNGNGDISGTYYYVSTKVPVTVYGELAYDGTLILKGDYDSAIKDTFVGKLYNDEYSGTWFRADGEKEWPFRLTRK